MDLAATDPEYLSEELHAWAKEIGFVIPMIADLGNRDRDRDRDHEMMSTAVKHRRHLRSRETNESLPTVFAHGMGDSCFNGGMESITEHVSDITGKYAVCIPTGANRHDDTINGYFMSMDDNIEVFAAKIQNDPALSNGFSAIGFSQGNNVIRGYIAKYNDPPVHTFISVNGVNAGISAVPYCIPKADHELGNEEQDAPSLHQKRPLNGKICDALMEIASHRAYSEFSQTHSFQANYWRDPRPAEKDQYQKYSQLAQMNNEGLTIDSTLNENWAKTQKFVWVLATEDTIVWPKEGEQWGAPNPNDPFDDILPMEETEWYKSDLFGLKTADLAGKNHFEKFAANHLRFSMDDFDNWVGTYLM